MQKALGFALLFIGASAFALATPPIAPEVGVGSAGSAIALVSGALLVIRGRRKK